MRNVINFIFTFLVLWAASNYFGDYVHIQDTGTLILATFLMFVMAYILGYALVFSILLIPIGIGCLTTIFLFVVALLFVPIRLYVLDAYLPGFDINGFWTYVALSISLMFFSVKYDQSTTESSSRK